MNIPEWANNHFDDEDESLVEDYQPMGEDRYDEDGQPSY